LMLLTFLGGVVVFFCSICLARRRSDPARQCFAYMKAGAAFFTAFCFVDMGAYAILVAYDQLEMDGDHGYGPGEGSLLGALLMAQGQFFVIAGLFECIAQLLIYLALVTLSLGIVLAQTGGRTQLDKVFAILSYAMSALLGIMAVAEWGIMVRVYLTYYGSGNIDLTSGLEPVASLWNAASRIDFAITVLIFVLALVLMARASMLLIKARAEPRVTTAANMLFACSIFFLLTATFDLAEDIKYVNLSNVTDDPKFDGYIDIVEACFSVIPLLVILCLLLALGNKTMGGLWTTDQPFMRFMPDGTGMQQQYPWGYDAQGFQGQPPMHQPTPLVEAWDDPPPRWSQRDMHQQVHELHGYGDLIQELPTHDAVMGLNHQADGTTPKAAPLPYPVKN